MWLCLTCGGTASTKALELARPCEGQSKAGDKELRKWCKLGGIPL